MGLAKAVGDLFLKVTRLMPRFYQTLQERLISPLVCRIAFIHKLESAGLLTHSPKSGMLLR